MVFETFSEPGFGRLRFGGGASDSADAELKEVLPLLIRLPEKGGLTADQIPAAQLQRIVDTAAGGPVDLSWEERGSILAITSLSKRTLSLSTKRPCGLRDLLFFACVLRVHRGLPEPSEVPLRKVFALAWECIIDELPQALDYCSKATGPETGFGYAPSEFTLQDGADPPRGKKTGR